MVGDPDQFDAGILSLEAEDGGARQAGDQGGFADVGGEARFITGRASSDNAMARRARRASPRVRRPQPVLTRFGLLDQLEPGQALQVPVRGRPLHRPVLLDGGLQLHDDHLHAELRNGPAALRAQHAAAVVPGDHTAVPDGALRVGGAGGNLWSRRRTVIAAGVRRDRRCPAVLSAVRGGFGRAGRAGSRYGQHRELRPVRSGLYGPGRAVPDGRPVPGRCSDLQPRLRHRWPGPHSPPRRCTPRQGRRCGQGPAWHCSPCWLSQP